MKKRRWSYIIGGFVALTALAFLLFNVWQHSDYYLEIPELKEKGESIYGERAQVRGNVAEGSITDDVEKRVLTFTITGEGESLAVVYEGVRPSNFDEGVEVVVEGSYGPTGVFDADQIITKCPSKYEPVE
jgi:cytochrome c-type biogenesis protein CcmE